MAILARINFNNWRRSFKKGERADLISYLDPRLVLFFQTESRDDALGLLVDALHNAGKLEDKETFYQAILEREKIVSTGIGIGVAIPHAKIQEGSDFFIAIGIQTKEGIPWNALDGSLVRMIFMIGGPADEQAEYLSLLSRLTLAIKDEERRKKLLKVRCVKDVISLFEGC